MATAATEADPPPERGKKEEEQQQQQQQQHPRPPPQQAQRQEGEIQAFRWPLLVIFLAYIALLYIRNLQSGPEDGKGKEAAGNVVGLHAHTRTQHQVGQQVVIPPEGSISVKGEGGEEGSEQYQYDDLVFDSFSKPKPLLLVQFCTS